MAEFLTVTEIVNPADAAAFGTALENTLVNDHGLTLDVNAISGESESRVLSSTGTNNRFGWVKPGGESLQFEAHHVSGEEWQASAGLAPIGAGPYTGLVARTPQKSFYPRYNSTTEKTIVVSNGVFREVSATGLVHEYHFNEASGNVIDQVGSIDFVIESSATRGSGPDAGHDTAALVTSSVANGDNFTANISGNSADFFPAGAWGHSFWLRHDDIASTGRVMSAGIPSVTSRLNVNAEAGGVFKWASNGFDWHTDAGTLVQGEWAHWVITWDGASDDIEIYKNGSLVNVTRVVGGPFTGHAHSDSTELVLFGFPTGNSQVAGSMDSLKFFTRYLTAQDALALSQLPTDTSLNATEQPTWLALLSHNTDASSDKVGDHYPVFMGRFRHPSGQQPYLSTLNTQANAAATTLDLVDAIYKDMDPDEADNGGEAVDLWLTNLTDGTQEKVQITSTPSGLTDPTVSALLNTFPAGSLVSDFPYKLQCSDLTDDGKVSHFAQTIQADLKESFNTNHEGTVVEVLDAHIDRTDLQHYWPMDETTGPLVDVVGGENFTLQGTASMEDSGRPGYSNSLRLADASTDRAEVIAGDISTFFRLGALPWTYEGWVNVDDFAGNGSFLVVDNGNPANSQVYSQLGATNWNVGSTPDGAIINTPHGLSTGVWHHLAIVYNGSTLYQYVDGVELANTAFAGLTSQAGVDRFMLGAQSTGTQSLDGRMDDWRIWFRDLSESELKSIVSRGQSLKFLDRVGTAPAVRCHGNDPAFSQSDVVHTERHELQGGFHNSRLWQNASSPAWPAPAHYWPCDDPDPNTTGLVDAVGGYDIDNVAAGTPVSEAAQIGNGVAQRSDPGEINSATVAPASMVTDLLTVSHWAKFENTSFSGYWTIDSSWLFLALSGGTDLIWRVTVGTTNYDAQLNISALLNSWVHIVGTYNATTGDAKLYVNGVLADTVNTGGGSIDAPVGGVRVKTNVTHLNFVMDEMAIHNFEAGADEVAAMYQRQLAGVAEAPPANFYTIPKGA